MRARRAGAASGLAVAVLLAIGPDPLHQRDSTPAPEPAPASATVTLYGRDGTFSKFGVNGTTPSGQKAATNAVAGWDFTPGVQAYRSTLAADGTVVVAGLVHDVNFTATTADRAVIAAYQPRTGRFNTVRLEPAGHSVADLEPANGAVAYITRSTKGAGSVGVLTEVDDAWEATQLGKLDGGPNDMATLPRSRDIVVAQYRYGLTVLRMTGPDSAGRFTVTQRGRYAYPGMNVREVQTDPTSRRGDERFTVGLEADRGKRYLVQEFSYDAATGKIRPVSAPLVPGDRTPDRTAAYGYGTFFYDHAGNLWVSRLNGLQGGKLAVYAAGAGRRRLASDQCRKTCRPDYDILQPAKLLGLQGFAQDPATGDILALSFGGTLIPIRVTGTGTRMKFRVGNVVDLGRKLLPVAGETFIDYRLGRVDSTHRAWLSAFQNGTDQWLYSVDIADLFDPEPVPVPDTPGRSVEIQAELTRTTTTTARDGQWATVDVDSDAFLLACSDWPAPTTCGYDEVAGDGFILGDDTGFGHLRNTVEYRIEVPSAGRYRLSYRVYTFPVIKRAEIALTVAGHTYTVPVRTGGRWRTIQAKETVALPTGVHTVKLSVPKEAGGWALNWFALRRA